MSRLIMASDKQIAANRRNAQNSSGPRSAAGKQRASRNATRHGLSKPMSGIAFTRAVEDLARRLVPDGADAAARELAREAARGMLELERVRRIEVALIERVSALGRLDPAKIFASKRDEFAWGLQLFGVRLEGPPKFADDDVPEMPTEEPQRTAEAVRRALPALLKLQRYEARAVARRDQAIRKCCCKTNPISF
jgi:hypothetical protein